MGKILLRIERPRFPPTSALPLMEAETEDSDY